MDIDFISIYSTINTAVRKERSVLLSNSACSAEKFLNRESTFTQSILCSNKEKQAVCSSLRMR